MTQHQRQRRLDVDEFLDWADAQPEGRFELADGVVIAMAPERIAHVRAKADAMLALRSAVGAAGLPCETFLDGVGVRVDDRTMYIPDVIVRCGPKVPNEARELDDPVILVEVVSPSTQSIDSVAKLSGYFRLPSLRHYLIVDPEARAVVHHCRTETGEIESRLVHGGTLALDPPGLSVEIEAFFVSL